ncbi:MAG: hypothetical protein IKA84_02985 [Clostridia bacterium]|nr:hypothetical protein [Clostridia bacterium]
MNNIYDFCEIEEIRIGQKRLIFQYVIYVICLICAVALACIYIKNNILFAAVFFFLVLFFALLSVVFWKIKYGFLKKRRLFLDDIESGKKEDYVGIFEENVLSSSDEDDFDAYIFVASNKQTRFLIHKQNETRFEKGKKYHLLRVGEFIYQWEIID